MSQHTNHSVTEDQILFPRVTPNSFSTIWIVVGSCYNVVAYIQETFAKCCRKGKDSVFLYLHEFGRLVFQQRLLSISGNTRLQCLQKLQNAIA